ncbi:MAG: peptidoglycan DD-metalloendopeptidase family protein [Pseudomonadales bacterium]
MAAVATRVAALAVVVALALGGCAQHVRPPVVDRSAPIDRPTVAQQAPGSYAVRAGDTLYSIAWRYGMDYRELARANGIGPPYTIYVGQQIRLTTVPQAGPQTPARAPQTARAPAPATPAPARPAPAQPAPAKPAPAKPAPSQPAPAQPASAPSAATAGSWRRPTGAPVQRSFGDGNRGIDYRLAATDSIWASAAGEVVYAGSGLGGFRHLVIVKHDAVHLSAYSFDRALGVREGQMVAAGAPLVSGQGGTVDSVLHFEIRRNGNPVDPRSLLGGS